MLYRQHGYHVHLITKKTTTNKQKHSLYYKKQTSRLSLSPLEHQLMPSHEPAAAASVLLAQLPETSV